MSNQYWNVDIMTSFVAAILECFPFWWQSYSIDQNQRNCVAVRVILFTPFVEDISGFKALISHC